MNIRLDLSVRTAEARARMVDPMKVRRLNLSYIDLFEVEPGRIADTLTTVRKPDEYYSFVSQSKGAPVRIQIPRFGSFRSGLRSDLPTEEIRPRLDEFWYNLYRFYYELAGKISNPLPCFACIPLVHAYLPSKNRTYSLDPSKLPGKSDKKVAKLSMSTYFFPLGSAISRTGVYLESETGLEPEDISALVKSPEKYLWVTVKGRKEKDSVKEKDPTHQGPVLSIVGAKQRGFYEAMVAQGPALFKSLGKYTVVDLIEVSRELDLKGDEGTISLMTGTYSGGNAASLKTMTYQDRVNILTPWTALLRLQASDDDFRRAYRRRVRNLAMLLLIQRSLHSRALGVSARELLESIKSGGPLQQAKNVIFPPKVQEAFSFLHYLTVYKPAFGDHHSVMDMYRVMRSLIDEEKSIDESTANVAACLPQIKGEIDKSGELASSVFSTVLSALLSHIPL